jgi:transcriptional regulator of arginine metabolism
MRPAARDELRRYAIPLFVAKISESELGKWFPVRFHDIADPQATREPALGALARLDAGQYFVIYYGKVSSELTVRIPRSENASAFLRAFLSEVPSLGSRVIWHRKGVRLPRMKASRQRKIRTRQTRQPRTELILKRRAAILHIVTSLEVNSIQGIRKYLRRHRVDVSRSTVSRDLHELGIVKASGTYAELRAERQVGIVLPLHFDEARLRKLIGNAILSAEAGNNIVVIKTHVAAAQSVAIAIEQAHLPGVLAMIGGDDTIFVALPNTASAAELASRLRSMRSSVDVQIPRLA